MMGGKEFYALAMLCVAFSGVLDLIDGPISRAFNMESDLGKFMDPLADKLSILLPLWLLPDAIKGGAFFLAVLIALTCIEFALMVKRTLTLLGADLGDKDISAGFAGKIKSFVEFFALGMVLVGLGVEWPWLFELGFFLITFCCLLAGISLAGHFMPTPKTDLVATQKEGTPS